MLDTKTIEIFISRLKYFEDKKVHELTDDEIKEYLKLREWATNNFEGVRDEMLKTWNAVKEYLKTIDYKNEE